jgi:hypothetical protein
MSYKISQMHVAVGVEQDIVWLDVSMDDALGMDVTESASQFCHPEPYRLFCESLT